MPIYTYRCPECGWDGTLLSSLDMRDEQRCLQVVSAVAEGLTREYQIPCGGLLIRGDVELTARTPSRWGV